MSFTEPKPGGWALEEELTSGQMNAFQANVNAMDASIAGDLAALDAALQAQIIAGDTALQVQVTLAAKRALLTGMRLRPIDMSAAAVDNSPSLAAISSTGTDEVIVIKADANGVNRFGDLPIPGSLGGITLASITSDVRKVAQTGIGRYLAVGAGGNKNAFSTDNGATWSAGGAVPNPTAALVDVVYDATQFVAWSDDEITYHSLNGTVWNAATIGSDTFNVLTGGTLNGLAVLVGGTVVAAGAITNPAFVKSINHGLTWTNTGGTVPNASDMAASRGWLAGNGGSEIYYLGKPAGTTLRFFASSNGSSWTLRSTITGLTFASGTPKLLMCQDTGLLVAIAPQSFGGVALSVSRDLGLTWTAHLNVGVASVHAIGVARGKLFATRSTDLFMSDGMET
jgi:hypothetical protein